MVLKIILKMKTNLFQVFRSAISNSFLKSASKKGMGYVQPMIVAFLKKGHIERGLVGWQKRKAFELLF